MEKVGRNDPCPCGSGKKFKKCHLDSATRVPLMSLPLGEAPPEVIAKVLEIQRKDRDRVKQFGQVRDDIGIEFKEYKFVAVGNSMYYSKNWKTFTDFIFDFIPLFFGKDWGEAESAKPENEQHQVVWIRRKAKEYLKKCQETQQSKDGVFEGIANGYVAAFLALAYDLYTVKHNGSLDDEFLQRLKHRDQFQGARHELFAEATCIRAGYSIEHEDERDRSKRHAEFVATHKDSKQKISVEAKSKHRPGVLGRSGTPETEEEMSVRFGGLLNDAIAKNPPHPLVVFLDINLPPVMADKVFSPESVQPFKPPKILIKLLDNLRKKNENKDPANAVIFSNHPHHYGNPDEADPKRHLMSIISQTPIKLVSIQAMTALHEAAGLYGNIPKELPTTG